MARNIDAIPGRPGTAYGRFLRIVCCSDVRTLDNYAEMAGAIAATRAASEGLDCEVRACMCGDFMGPSELSAFDGGLSMVEALNAAGFDFVSLGDREFDVGFRLDRHALATKLKTFRGTVLSCNALNAQIAEVSAPYAVVEVGETRRVVFCGATTDDPAQYPPGSMPKLEPVFESIKTAWRQAKLASGLNRATSTTAAVLGVPRIVEEDEEDEEETATHVERPREQFNLVPMTHQPIDADARLVDRIAGDRTLSGRVPVVLGGHDRVVKIDETQAGGATIVKASSNGCDIAVVDVWWTEADADAVGEYRQPRRRISLLPAADFEPEPNVAALCARKRDFLEAMLATPVSAIEVDESIDDASTHHHPHDVISSVLLMAKRACKKHDVEVALLSAAAVRPGGFADLKLGDHLFAADLFDALVHDSPMCVVRLPGAVLADAVRSSRFDASIKQHTLADKYLHCDAGVQISDAHDLLTVDGDAFSTHKTYAVLLDRALLLDGDHAGRLHAAGAPATLHVNRKARMRGSVSGPTPPIELLHAHVADAGLAVPNLELCTPIKTLVVEFCMRDTWRRVVGFGQWDDHHDLPHDVFLAVIHQTFEHLDDNKDGAITVNDLLATFDVVADSVPSAPLVAKLIASLDVSGSGQVPRDQLGLVAF